jgi:four helix bundle protein
MNSYQELIVWQKSIDLVAEIYKLTESFPNNEMYGLTSQMRRAAVSIPANIAEGFCRKHKQEYAQFVRIAFGSGGELETHLVIAKRLGFVDVEKYEKIEPLLLEVMKMLNKLIQSLTTSR